MTPTRTGANLPVPRRRQPRPRPVDFLPLDDDEISEAEQQALDDARARETRDAVLGHDPYA